jgi:hypothetical protein
VTFYEALKANEFKRVKAFHDGRFMGCWDVMMLIDEFNKRQCYGAQWRWTYELVEEPLEFWACVLDDNSVGVSRFDLKEKAANYCRSVGHPYIALFREVPGTREEVNL